MPRGKKLGDIVEINLPNGLKAYGRVYREGTIGIYNGSYNSFDEINNDVGYFRFIALYSKDLNSLRTVTNIPFKDGEDTWAPDKVMVDAITGRGRLYHHGEIYPCTYEECKDLEVVAVWHIFHLIDMLMGDDKWDKAMRKPKNLDDKENYLHK